MPKYLKSTQTRDSIIYEIDKKTKNLIENIYSKYSKTKSIHIYNTKLDLISNIFIDSTNTLFFKSMIFKNIKNIDTLFQRYPNTKIEIYNYDTLNNVVNENYYSTNSDENYQSKSVYKNGILDSVIYFKKNTTSIQKYDSRGKQIQHKQFDLKTNKVIHLEESKFDSLNRIISNSFSNIYFYNHKYFSYDENGYCIEEISEESQKVMYFDKNENLITANFRQFIEPWDAACCNEIKHKYDIMFSSPINGIQNINITYDQFQNWTKVEVFENGKLVKVNTREIEYY